LLNYIDLCFFHIYHLEYFLIDFGKTTTTKKEPYKMNDITFFKNKLMDYIKEQKKYLVSHELDYLLLE
jgi:hypothetical protein